MHQQELTSSRSAAPPSAGLAPRPPAGAGAPIAMVILCCVAAGAVAATETKDWPQWGGPDRNFVLSDRGLATAWPADGPRVLWRRPLGDHGHSAIVTEGGRLYTSFRRGDDDIVVALDASNGSTLWEQSYASPVHEAYNLQFGPGPHSTPALGADLVFTVSSTFDVAAWDKSTGERRWARDLMADLEWPPMFRGYGSSPLLWQDLILLNAGGEGQGVIALRQHDGSEVWRALDTRGGYSSPVLMTFDGVEHVVIAQGFKRAGLDPATGKVLWQIDLPESAATTMSTLVQVGPDLIFGSSAYADGSRLLRVARGGDNAWTAEEVWYSRSMRVMHGVVAPFDDLIYGSSGDFGPAFLAALRLDDGELAFRQRGFAKANVMRVGDHVLILDEDGMLALGAPGPQGIEVLARAQVLDGVSWTAPTLVGTTLYVRNRTELVALDLARQAGADAPLEATASTDRPTTDRPTVESVAVHSSRPSEATVPERSESGQALAIPEAMLDAGKVFHVLIGDGDDTQVVVASRTPWQRVVALNSRTVGYVVSPFDLEDLAAGASPILAAAVRIPAASFDTGGTAMTDMLVGGLFLDAAQHPDLTVRFVEALEVERLPVEEGDGDDVFRYRLRAKAELGFRGRTVPIEVPVELVLRNSSRATMRRYVGDLAQLAARFEVALADLGIELPAPLVGHIANSLEIDLFLTLSTVSPDRTLNPQITREAHIAEMRFLTLLRDQGKEAEAQRFGETYLREAWNDPQALDRMAYYVVAEHGIEPRALGLAVRAARRAVELTEGQNALLLDTLARILAERGDVDEAITMQKRALELIDAQEPQSRSDLEQNLARYEALATR